MDIDVSGRSRVTILTKAWERRGNREMRKKRGIEHETMSISRMTKCYDLDGRWFNVVQYEIADVYHRSCAILECVGIGAWSYS